MGAESLGLGVLDDAQLVGASLAQGSLGAPPWPRRRAALLVLVAGPIDAGEPGVRPALPLQAAAAGGGLGLERRELGRDGAQRANGLAEQRCRRMDRDHAVLDVAFHQSPLHDL